MENSIWLMFAFLPFDLEMANSKLQRYVSLLTSSAGECVSKWAMLNACCLPASSGFSASLELLINLYLPTTLAYLCCII